MSYWFIGGCATVILGCGYLSATKYGATKNEKVAARRRRADKWLLGIMLAMALFNVFLPDLWCNRLDGEPNFLALIHDPAFSVARLFSAAILVTLPIALRYHRKTFTRFCVYLGIPTFFANMLLVKKYLFFYAASRNYPLTLLSRPFAGNETFRAVFFAVFEGIKLFLILRVAYRNRQDLHFTGIVDFAKFILFCLPLTFVNMPISFFNQHTGGFGKGIVLKSCNWVNFVWIGLIVLLCFGYTVLFRRRSAEDKYILLVVLTLSLFFQYISFFQTSELTMVVRLPFQLCNFACVFLPVAVLSNKRPLLCFASIINVVGALPAVLICDTPGEDGLFHVLNMHYILEHTGIIVVGFLLLSLGFITPLRKKDLWSVLKVFTAYFLFVLVLGTVFNAIHVAHDSKEVVIGTGPIVMVDFHCNYLFMFLEDVVVDVAPPLAVLYRNYLPIGRYARLQPSQAVMYLALVGICVGSFYAFSAIFNGKKSLPKKQK